MTGNRHIVVVGAGFSAGAGLPLASRFTAELLNTHRLPKTGDSYLLIQFIQRFVDRIFGDGTSVDQKFWPEMEDLFTTVDLAANSGHHLGHHFSPAQLRTVRRALIARTIRMLRIAQDRGERAAGPEWQQVAKFLNAVPPARTAFLSMNWDTVIEAAMAKRGAISLDYGCGARAGRFRTSGIVEETAGTGAALRLLKPHGSINWMYCDCCSAIWWFPARQVLNVASRIFTEQDRGIAGTALQSQMRDHRAAVCPACDANALGTRLATFSYRKALDFPMHGATWRAADAELRMATTWTFIGYSMPAADYEFKHMLKRVHLARRTAPPRITVITGGGAAAAAETLKNYRRFLGVGAIADTFDAGLTDEALIHLRSIGVLI